MPFTPETLAEKPYNQCIKCDKLSVVCDGPNFASMSKERFCEWCRLRKEYLGWSNLKLAEITGLSKTTIDRIMAGTTSGLNSETMNILGCALVYEYNSEGNSWGKIPCPISFHAPKDDTKAILEENAKLRLQIAQMKDDEAKKVVYLKNHIDFEEEQLVEKDMQLRRKDRIIGALCISLGVCVLLIVAAIVVDIMCHDVGFFFRR